MLTCVIQRAATAERLAEVVTMRRQLCDQHVAIEIRPLMLRMLSCGRMAEIIAADTILAQRYELLTASRSLLLVEQMDIDP